LGGRINISYILIALNDAVKTSIRGEAAMYGRKGQSQINTQGRRSDTERDDSEENL
jgi:rRNA processing protein Gar1